QRGRVKGGVSPRGSHGVATVTRAVKPTSSLPRPQPIVTRAGEPMEISTRGRHDPCLLPRFVPMGEAMVALVLAAHWLRWRAQCGGPAALARRRPDTAAPCSPRRHPDDFLTCGRRGFLLLLLGRDEEARSDLDAFRRRSPDDAGWL